MAQLPHPVTRRLNVGLGQTLLIAAGVVSLSAFASSTTIAGARTPNIAKVDSRDYPVARLYVNVPNAKWNQADVRVEFEDRLSTESLAAMKAARLAHKERAAEIAKNPKAKDELPEVPPVPGDPAFELRATFKPFATQDDPSEAVTVVLLIDVSGSMSGTGIEQVREHAAALVNALRPIDRVAVFRFAESLSVLMEPTTDHQSVTSALAAVKADGKETRLFDALASTLQRRLKQQVDGTGAASTLPGRRFLFVFSDGLDSGSRIKVDDFRAMMLAGAEKLTVFTVGVGDRPDGKKAKAGSPFADLHRVAGFAGDVDRFLELPSSDSLATAFKRELDKLTGTLLLAFTAPPYYHAKGAHAATLHVKPDGRDAWSTKVQLQADTVPEPVLAQRASLLASIKKIEDWHNDKVKASADKDAYLQYGLIVGGALILLIIIVLLLRRSARAREARRSEEMQNIESQMEAQFSQLGQQGAELRDRMADEAKRAEARSRVALAELLAMDGPLKTKRFGILKPNCVAGREMESCDLVFPSEGGDMAISRTHARFAMSGGGWTVTCLSKGGMDVRGRSVRQGENYPIQGGDTLRIGKTLFEFRPA